MLGHHYYGLEQYFGVDIAREDANNGLFNLKKLAAGRSDVTIMANTVYRYGMASLRRQGETVETLHTIELPNAQIQRAIFIAQDDETLANALDRVVNGMKGDHAWKAILTKYGLQ